MCAKIISVVNYMQW